MDSELLKLVASVGGIGAVFAVMMFTVYRNTIIQMREDRKFMEERLAKITESYNTATQENTKVLSELYTYLKMRNGSKT